MSSKLLKCPNPLQKAAQVRGGLAEGPLVSPLGFASRPCSHRTCSRTFLCGGGSAPSWLTVCRNAGACPDRVHGPRSALRTPADLGTGCPALGLGFISRTFSRGSWSNKGESQGCAKKRRKPVSVLWAGQRRQRLQTPFAAVTISSLPQRSQLESRSLSLGHSESANHPARAAAVGVLILTQHHLAGFLRRESQRSQTTSAIAARQQ